MDNANKQWNQCFAIFLIALLAFVLGMIVGKAIIKRNTDYFNPAVRHMNLEAEGYRYCPYCGEAFTN